MFINEYGDKNNPLVLLLAPVFGGLKQMVAQKTSVFPADRDFQLCVSKLLRGSVHVPAFDESAG